MIRSADHFFIKLSAYKSDSSIVVQHGPDLGSWPDYEQLISTIHRFKETLSV
jgi:hypothetical protein